MQRSRDGLGTAWLWALVACAACSGKTAVIGEGTDAGSGGSAVAPAEGGSGTGGTNTGGEPTGFTGGDASGTGGKSEPASGGALFGCGSESCVEGKSYCYNHVSATPGTNGRTECRPLTEDCADCACLCPPVTPDGQCSGSDDLSANCLCGGEPGKIVVSCFG